MIDKIKRFEAREVRTHWDAEQDKWYFSIVDVLAVLTESLDPAAYWRKLKQRLKTEGNQSVTNCHALKMRAADGRSRLHPGHPDALHMHQMFQVQRRLVSNQPSKLQGNAGGQ